MSLFLNGTVSVSVNKWSDFHACAIITKNIL